MIVFALSMAIISAGIYALAMKDNILKKLLGMSVISNGIHIFLISLGFREGGGVPVISGMDISGFAATAVDPLPQALVLTSIVISLSVLAVGLSISILLYRHYGTLDSRKIRRLSG